MNADFEWRFARDPAEDEKFNIANATASGRWLN